MTRPWTPPAVKWTANELAALKGELNVIDRELKALRRQREVVRARVDALERVLGMVAPEVPLVPLVHVPVVHAQKRFGGYGNLRGWLLATLEAAYPQALDTGALLEGGGEGLRFDVRVPGGAGQVQGQLAGQGSTGGRGRRRGGAHGDRVAVRHAGLVALAPAAERACGTAGRCSGGGALMALTMTRTRTQTALTKLVDLLARVNGELDFVRELQVEAPEGLAAREVQLVQQRQALMLTIQQFDPELDPEDVGSAADWWPSRRPKTRAGMVRRYLAATGQE